MAEPSSKVVSITSGSRAVSGEFTPQEGTEYSGAPSEKPENIENEETRSSGEQVTETANVLSA